MDGFDDEDELYKNVEKDIGVGHSLHHIHYLKAFKFALRILAFLFLIFSSFLFCNVFLNT